MCNCSGLIKAIDAFIMKADDNLKKRLEKEGFLNAEETVDAATELEDKVAEALVEETELLTSDLKEVVDLEAFYADIWPEVKAADDLDVKLFDVFKNQFETIMPQLITAYIKQTDSDLMLVNTSKRTTAWITDWSEELGRLMKLNSHSEIEQILLEGLDEGLSVEKVTQSILESGIRDEYYKARRTAITEMLRAHSVARQEGLIQSPAVEEKEWVHTGAYRIKPRENHIAISGQIVPKDEPFKLIGADGARYYPMYPRDSILPPGESVNCHCIHRGIVSKKVLGLSLEDRKKLQEQAIADDDGAWEKEIDARNKAKAGINEETIKMDWLKNKDKNEQVKYLGSESRWALDESGVIKDDKDLQKLFKTTTTKSGKKVVTRKTLNELKKDGIITIRKSVVNHSSKGEYTGKSKMYPNGRPIGGAHSVAGLEECKNRGIEYNVTKTFTNGVTLGNIPCHKQVFKRSGDGQAWFPEEWTDDDILVAGTFVSNSSETVVEGHQTAIYNGVAVRVLYDKNGDITTICPDYDQETVKGVKVK